VQEHLSSSNSHAARVARLRRPYTLYNIGRHSSVSRSLRQARAAFCAAFITVFFIRFSPAQYKLISWPSGSLR
jgi:hypothetical protein